jgi:hypothetical protein
MRRLGFWVSLALVITLLSLSYISLKTPTVLAKTWGFTNADFSGVYGSQWTGSINFPALPFSALNGPYALLGRLVSDGQGAITARFIESYNGQIARNEGKGAYTVRPNGTLTMMVSYVTSALGKITFEAEGVLFDDGRQVRLQLTKWVEPALPPGFTGMVATGSLMRQAKSWGWTNADITGSYASRYTGTVSLPAQHPLSILNGPMAIVGRSAMDSEGNVKADEVLCFNGAINRLTNVATLAVNQDGTLRQVVPVDFGALGKATLVFDGVLTDMGNQVFLMLTDLLGVGLPPGYTGVVMAGIEIRQ